jgi:hypothetical protein
VGRYLNLVDPYEIAGSAWAEMVSPELLVPSAHADHQYCKRGDVDQKDTENSPSKTSVQVTKPFTIPVLQSTQSFSLSVSRQSRLNR